MKKLTVLLFSILLTLGVSAQIDIDKSKINPAYLKFLPSNANPEDLRPSDIPSEQVLKQMGLSDKEITEAIDFKFSRGKYAKEVQDTIMDNEAGHKRKEFTTKSKSAIKKFWFNWFGDVVIPPKFIKTITFLKKAVWKIIKWTVIIYVLVAGYNGVQVFLNWLRT